MSANEFSPAGLLLLCVDLQPAFLSVIVDHEKITRRCAFAIQAAVGLNLDVVFTEQVPAKLGATSPTLLSLAPGAAVFGKNSFSALADAAVRESFESRQVEHVLLCGIETPVCVYQTAIDLLANGQHVTILSDCVGARRPVDATVCLEALARAGAHILPAETVFYSLLRDATHPFFKTYTKLVKDHG